VSSARPERIGSSTLTNTFSVHRALAVERTPGTRRTVFEVHESGGVFTGLPVVAHGTPTVKVGLRQVASRCGSGGASPAAAQAAAMLNGIDCDGLAMSSVQ
jgi:hypothetical protein